MLAILAPPTFTSQTHRRTRQDSEIALPLGLFGDLLRLLADLFRTRCSTSCHLCPRTAGLGRGPFNDRHSIKSTPGCPRTVSQSTPSRDTKLNCRVFPGFPRPLEPLEPTERQQVKPPSSLIIRWWLVRLAYTFRLFGQHAVLRCAALHGGHLSICVFE